MKNIKILLIIYMSILASSSTYANHPQTIEIKPGLSAIFTKDSNSSITVIHFLFPGGKKAEPIKMSGVAYLATGLATSVPDPELLSQLMHRGSRFSFQVNMDFSLITMKCLSEKLEETLDILTGVMKKPLFSSTRIANMKRNMESQFKAEDDDPGRLLSRLVREFFFQSTPLEGSIYGNKESRKHIKRKDIAAYYHNFFSPGNMTISISSNLKPQGIIDMLRKDIQDFPKALVLKKNTIKFSPPKKKKYYIKKERKQTLIAFATPLPGVTKENFVLSFLLENILGKGMGSRLWQMRTRHSLTYYPQASFTQMVEAGILKVYATVRNRDRQKTYNVLQDILKNLWVNGLKESEFKVAKEHAKADFLRINETKAEKALTPAYFSNLGLGMEFYWNFLEEIDKIPLDKMNKHIRKVLNPQHVISITMGKEDVTALNDELP